MATETTSNPSVAEKEGSQSVSIVSLIYKPQVIEQNAPRILMFPANEDAARALASDKLALNNSQLQLDSIVLIEGVVHIPYSQWQAAASHPPTAAKIQKLVEQGALEIITPEIGDVSGLSTDTALTIHYTETKAMKLIANSFDEEWLRTCMAHENVGISSKGRPNVYNALRQRLDTVIKMKSENRKPS